MKKLILASLLLSTVLLAAGSAYAAALYFPHVATSIPWQTEIAIINTSSDQTVTGTLMGLSDEGQLVEIKNVTLSARGRRQINVADEFTNHINIGYIIFDTNSAAVQGYTKFYREGYYRAAIPAVKEVNTSDIYISHIASNAQWWTGVSLVNTTSATKELTIAFNTGQSRSYTLNAGEHRAFDIASLFNNQPQPDIQSAVITNASGIIGLELFGSNDGGSNHLDGILLTDNTASTIYYPHVASDDHWWTGIVAYNPSWQDCYITITPYSAQGTPLSPSTLPIAGKEKYIGAVSQLGLPAQTAWFKIDSTTPLSGFELFGTTDGNQLAAYAGGGGTSAKAGVFAKIEKNGWTGIAFVNTEASAASVTLTAYNDNGTAVATRVLPVGGYAKVVNNPEAIFTQDISSATYIVYSSDKNVVGFQLNGSSDGTMLDGLPGLAGDGNGGGTIDAATTYNNYNKSVASLSSAAQTFLLAVQKWEGSDFTNMTVAEIRAIFKSYTDSGNQFVSALNGVNTSAAAIKNTTEKTVKAGGLPSGASVSPTLPIAVGGVINETITSMADLDSLYNAGKIDPNEYKIQVDKLRTAQTLKAAGIGVSTIVGIAGGAVVGAGLTLAAAPGAVVIGGGLLAAAVVGKTVSWIWNSACGGTKMEALATTSTDASSCKMSTGQTASGASFPNLMEEGGTMIISIPGYVPIVITNFNPPKSGNQLTIDFTPIPVDSDNPSATITIDYNEIAATATSCSQILSITGLPSPLDPGPGQGVTVTATVFPAIAGCDISFSITGTDGYSNTDTPKTNASGQASFFIPGGDEGVHDTVSMGSNGKTHIVTYTF